MNSEKLYHLDISKEITAEYALVTGDPGRVELISSFFDNPVKLGSNREYTSYQAYVKDKRVLIASTGIGGPSAAICIEELAMLGVRNVIRIGTCGGINEKVDGSELVIPFGAVRMEGTSREYLPIEFPAVADFGITGYLTRAADELGVRYHTGIVQTKDSFYSQHNPERMPVGYELMNKWSAWIKSGVLASEMECAAIFTVSSVLGIRSGAVLLAVWNQVRKEKGIKTTQSFDILPAIRTATTAIKMMIENSL